MITLERLREIAASITASGGWRDGTTPEERKEINDQWERMPGEFSFHNAVLQLILEAEGKAPAPPPLVTRLFTVRDHRNDIVAGLEGVTRDNALLMRIAWGTPLSHLAVEQTSHGVRDGEYYYATRTQ